MGPALEGPVRAVVSGASPWPLVMYGPPGTGKTCAALVLLDHAGGEYHTAADWARCIIDAQQKRLSWHREGQSGPLTEEMIYRAITAAPLVVLDELGTRERASDHAYEVTKRLIDAREFRPLVVISNLDMDALAKVYDDRVTSRLGRGTVLHVEADDRRLTE